MNIYEKLIQKKTKLSVIGLGYVGLPIALGFAKQIKVIGFDINQKRLELLKKNIDPSNELSKEEFESCDIEYTSDPEKLKEATFHIIAVPTPTDRHNLPDLKPLLLASETAGKIIKKGDYVVYESTVYPGCTEEDCVPVLEKFSGLKFKEEFKAGYSPERINPGDKFHNLNTVIKIVSGCDAESLEMIAETYSLIAKAGVHKAPFIKVAEAAKIIENTQRDVNIALVNELSIIFNRMGINTYDVLEAAGTKWNFLKFYPGLVGGHCIGVDPYYLAFKAEEYRYHPQVIKSGRYVNDSMGFYVAKQMVKKIISCEKNVYNSNVLVMGATFKENISDIRNSRTVDIVTELKSYGVNVTVTDPYADPEEFFHEYHIKLSREKDISPGNFFDAVVIAVAHKPYLELKEEYFLSLTNNSPVIIDVKGIYRNKIKKMLYWSL